MSLNTTPATWVAGSVVTATQMNTEVRDAITGIQAAWTADARASSAIWLGSTTNPAIGNGTLVSRYNRTGKTVEWQVKITIGSTTTFGSGGYQLALPFNALNTYACHTSGRTYDSSVSSTLGYDLRGDLNSVTTLDIRTAATTAGNVDRGIGPTVPFTYGTGDIISVYVRYEAA